MSALAVNTQRFQLVQDIRGDDADDTALLLGMARTAREYITSFGWCPPIDAMYLAHGVGGVVAVFFVEFPRKINGTDDKLWIVIGNLPSAYLVVEPDDSPGDALERYCGIMEDWIAAVRDGGDLSGVYPISAEPSRENADLLERRVAFLLAEIIPRMTQPGW
jgi:hypothetical protein